MAGNVSDFRTAECRTLFRKPGQFGIIPPVYDPLCAPGVAMEVYGIALRDPETSSRSSTASSGLSRMRSTCKAGPAPFVERLNRGGALVDEKSVVPTCSVPAGVHHRSL
jgi:hypothetical protein